MTKETSVFQALIKREPHFLEKPLEELLPLRFMGEVAVHAYQGLIRRLDDLPLAQEEKQAKLKDGQDAGRALLMIEARIGKLAEQEPQAFGEAIPPRQGGGRRPSAKPPKHERLGMTASQLKRAEAIAAHPEVVEEVIKEAEENEDIPTKTAVLNKIAYKRELERVKGKREKTKLEMVGEAYLYYSKLLQALALIPVKPPQELREKDFLIIKAVALTIIQKLKEFINENTEVSSKPIRRLPSAK